MEISGEVLVQTSGFLGRRSPKAPGVLKGQRTNTELETGGEPGHVAGPPNMPLMALTMVFCF